MIFEFGTVSETLSATLTSEGKLIKRYKSRFLAGADFALTRDQVCAMIGVVPGAPHWEWPWATCRDVSCERIMSREPCYWWYVDVEHSTDAPRPQGDGGTDAAPELRRCLRKTGTSQQQRAILRDRNGDLIVDAAGSPYNGGVPVTAFLGTITWTRDELHNSLSMAQAKLLSGHLNETTFMGCEPETLMMEVVGEEKWEGDYHFWTFTYTATYDPLGWQPRPLNAGLYQKVAGKRERIMEDDDTPTQEPQPLTLAGAVVPLASRPGACNFVEVDHYYSYDFAELGLPIT